MRSAAKEAVRISNTIGNDIMKSEAVTCEGILGILSELADEIRTRFNVRRLGLFGSYVHGSASRKSDLDILVEFDEPTFDNYMDLKFFLEELFQEGVDLVMADTLKRSIKPHILSEVVYAEGL